jgi:adenylosuccinate synthase
MGREFGATTGRPRRCGWFDAVAVRHAVMINGIERLAVTNLDGLDTVDVIKICIGYKYGSQKYDYVPSDVNILARVEPIYAEFEGWKTPTTNAKSWKELPRKTKDYLNAISELTGARPSIISVGPDRSQTIFV